MVEAALRRQQERPPADTNGIDEHQHGAVRRDAERSGWRSEPLPAAPAVWRPPVHAALAYQNYNAFQSLLSRWSSRFSFTTAYTLSKALGIRGGGQGGQGQVAALPADIRGTAYGVLGYDRPHVLNIGYSYLLPDFEGDALKQALARRLAAHRRVDLHQRRAAAAADEHRRRTSAWTAPSRTAQPINNPRLIGTNAIAVMPVLTCDPRAGSTAISSFNPSCFALPARGSNGNYIFPTLRGQGYINHDFAVFKNFAMDGQPQVPVPRGVDQRLQSPAAVPRRQRQPEPRLHERRDDERELRRPPARQRSTAAASSSWRSSILLLSAALRVRGSPRPRRLRRGRSGSAGASRALTGSQAAASSP